MSACLKINLSLLLWFLSLQVSGQEWNFIKEKDGIKIYTKKEKGNSLKSFRGVTDIRASMEEVTHLIGNVKNLDWWDKNLREIRVLRYEPDKYSQYYLVYDAPWPVNDRDLCVEAKITDDPFNGTRTIMSTPMTDIIPEQPGIVRITNYWQRWIMTPGHHGKVHVVLEGYVDPAGSVPDWIYNFVITETPLKIMRGIKEKLER